MNAVEKEREGFPAVRLVEETRKQEGMRLPKAWIRLELDNVAMFGSHHGTH